MDLLDEVRAQLRLPSPEVARSIRQDAGVTQTRLGAELGVHRVTVARWEAGKRRPTGQQRVAYATLLDQLRNAVAAA
ncbi:helix-turn-helix domain-containing protein [Phytohabitans rumicis]|uniref:HTH cro/C1-type domain-containing protein n=1 Tax=Phytohabitans rumicis TaxID=1076125 RepID=A0A6V8LAY8_9ACTN|nr:helix-turn-helix transcriptional regulator [Phytohabitans rumicis]GFJ91709.1 hypothetical protein Prum_053510 [Phytohabitans rumicis]